MIISYSELKIGDRLESSGCIVKYIENGIGNVKLVTIETSKGSKLVKYSLSEKIRICDPSRAYDPFDGLM